MRVPSGENETDRITFVWPSSFASCSPVLTFNTRTVLSHDPKMW
jgi:hypothetical protein